MRSKRLSVYLLCLVLVAGTAAYLIHSAVTAPTQPAPAASARTPLPPPRNIDLQMLVDQYLHNKVGILGTIVQVDLRGQESLTAASGFFDISRTRPVKPNDKFQIGSITKVFTASLVHQLIERFE